VIPVRRPYIREDLLVTLVLLLLSIILQGVENLLPRRIFTLLGVLAVANRDILAGEFILELHSAGSFRFLFLL